VALSAVLLALSVAAPALVSAALLRRSFTTVSGRGSRAAPWELGSLRGPAVAAVGGFVALGALLPLAVLLALSVTDQVGRGWGPGNWSLEHYTAILGRGRELEAIGRSLALAAGAATVTTAVGALVAVIEIRTDIRGREALAWLARTPYTVPGTVLALAMLLTWSQEIRLVLLERVTLVLALADTAWLLLLAYSIKLLALPVAGVAAGLRSVSASLEEAARVSGASFFATLRHVTVPLLWTNLAAAWFLVFVPAFSEVTMSVLLAGPRNRVVGVVLFDLQTYGDPPAAAALAVIVAAIAIGGQAVAGPART
jgi:iron(III) transport system permease protein